jgi:DNA repair protein RadD
MRRANPEKMRRDMKTLRDDQTKAITQLRYDVSHGERRIVLQAPTGWGKGVMISDIVGRARLKDKHVLITVPAISLVDQTVEVLYAQGITDIGAIQAAHPMTDWSQPIQVASVQTLQRRWADGKMPKADVVLVDEVHRWFVLFPKWMCDLAWAKVPFVGFSATPWTKGLGTLYSQLIVAGTIDNLINQGTLVPFRTFAPDRPDLSNVSVVAGDFVAAELDRVMRPAKLVANIVETWREKAAGRPTVCFCCSRGHADQVAKEFQAAGIGSGYMDCDTPRNERAAIRNRMLRGEVQVVCNVEIVGIGIDWPEVSCIIYARPTMSDMRFVQNIGRGLRTAPGKTDLLILDHSTTTMRLGFVNDIYALHTQLDDGKPKPPQKTGVLLPKECPACHYLKAPRVVKCPNCGFEHIPHAKPVAVQRGTLREIKTETEKADLLNKLPDKSYVYGQLLWWARQKGYKEGWAANKYREIFDVWPRGLSFQDKISAPVPALIEHIYRATEKWKRQQQYARRKERAKDDKLTDREEELVARIREQYAVGLCTEQDLEDFT